MGNKNIKCYNATIIKETEEGIRQNLRISYFCTRRVTASAGCLLFVLCC